MRAFGLAEIIESRHADFKSGAKVLGLTGLQDLVIIPSNDPRNLRASGKQASNLVWGKWRAKARINTPWFAAWKKPAAINVFFKGANMGK